MKMDKKLRSLDDMRHMLNTLRFWGSDEIPQELISFCFKRKHGIKELLEDYSEDLPHFKVLYEAKTSDQLTYGLEVAVRASSVVVMQHLHTYYKKHVNSIKLKGFFDMLFCGIFSSSKSNSSSCPVPFWREEICTLAAEHGSLECLIYAREHGCPWNADVCDVALANGHEACVLYALQHDCPVPTCIKGIGGRICFTHHLAKAGMLTCLRVAHERGVPWDRDTCAVAAGGGHLHCLRYAYENGCPWSAWTTENAAMKGHVECLRYAIENDCHYYEWTLRQAARHGHLECVQLLCDVDCPMDASTAAAAEANFECLQHLLERGCDASADTLLRYRRQREERGLHIPVLF